MTAQRESSFNFCEIPKYQLPEHVPVHPDYKDMKEQCDAWYLGYSTSQKLVLSDIPLCTALMYPEGKNGLLLLHISKLFVWLFDLEDKIEEHMKKKQVEWVLEYLDKLDGTLKTMQCDEDFVEGRIFIELWQEMQPYLQKRVGDDLIAQFRNYMRIGKDIQVNYRLKSKPIELNKYMDYRNIDSLLVMIYPCLEYAQQIDLKNDIYTNDVKTLHDLSLLFTTLVNDIRSFNFEYKRGDIMNYIISMQAETELSFQECVNKAYEEEKEVLHKLQNHIEHMKLEYVSNKPLYEYIETLDVMQVGYMKFHEISSRYVSLDGKTFY